MEVPTSQALSDVPLEKLAAAILPSPPRHLPRLGRRAKFAPEEDIIIIREVCSVKAHVAPQGATGQRFEIFASKVNATKKVSVGVSWMAFQGK